MMKPDTGLMPHSAYIGSPYRIRENDLEKFNGEIININQAVANNSTSETMAFGLGFGA